MTDPIALARHQLEEIAQLLPEVEAYAELLSLRGHGPNLAGITTLTGSPVENTIIRREREQAPLDALSEIAAEWGWTTSDGPVLAYLLNRIDKAASLGLIIGHHLTEITRAHQTITRLVLKPTPGPVCPLHDHLPATTIVDGNYHCHDCDTTRNPDDHAALTTWIIRQHNPLVTAHQAATLLNQDPGTIRQRIHRRQPSRHHPNLYRIQDLA